jgi:HEAT repeat protein
MRRIISASFVLCVVGLARAEEEAAPWLAAVTSEEDRSMLGGLVSEVEAQRQGFAEQWERERLEFLRAHRSGGFPPGPRDEMDPAQARDAFELRKVRVTAGLVIALERGGPSRRVAACRSIADMVPAYSNARRALGAAVDDPDGRVREAAILALARLRPFEGGARVEEFVPRLVEHLSDEDPGARRAAIDVVGYLMGDAARDALHHRALTLLGHATAASQPEVRASAYTAIAALAASDAWSVMVFKRGLGDPVGIVRERAALALERAAERARGDEVRGAVPRLRELLSDPGFDVRWATAQALFAITQSVEGLVRVATEALETLETAELAVACRLLCRMGPEASAAAPALVGSLGKVPHWRHVTTGEEPMEALLSVGPELRDVREAIVKRLADPDPDVQRQGLESLHAVHATPDEAAELALERLALPQDAASSATWLWFLAHRAPERPESLTRVRAAVASGDPGVRLLALRVCGHLAARAEEFVPALRQALGGPLEAHERTELLGALARIGTPSAIVLLGERLGVPDESGDAGEALTLAGPRGAPALSAVLAWAERAPEAAARCLAALGPAVAPALPRVLAWLPAASGARAVHLAEAARHGGADPAIPVAALVRVLAEPSEALRAQAALALGAWGPKASAGLPVLVRLRDASGKFDDDGIAAAVAAYQIDGVVAPAYDRCLDVVRSSHPPDVDAIRGLGLLGPAAADAVPELVKAALHWREAYWKDEERTLAALEALGRIGLGARASLPVIRSLERNRLFTEAAAAARRRIE